MTQVNLKAYWADFTAESALSISGVDWELIKRGGEKTFEATAFYEGGTEIVAWNFANATVTIFGEGAAQHLIDAPLEELVVC
mgnify:CR=1 FL=1